MSNLILFCGKPGNYKSYISNQLAVRGGYMYLPTSAFLKYSNSTFNDLNSFRQKRYDIIYKWLQQQQNNSVNIILDGGYMDKEERVKILCLNWTVSALIFCNNEDEGMRYERIRIKAADFSNYENIAAQDILARRDNKKLKLTECTALKEVFGDDKVASIGIEVNVDFHTLRTVFSSNQNECNKITQALTHILNDIKSNPISSFYQKRVSEHFDQMSKSYDTSTEWRKEDSILKSLLVGQENRKLRVLDIATGTGICGAVFEKLGHDVTGIDLSKQMLKKAETRVKNLVWGDAHELPFLDASFDIAIMRQCLHYLHTQIALKEANRVLKHNGFLTAACAYWPNLSSLCYWEEFKSKTQPLRNKIITEPFLIDQLYKANFVIKKIIYNNILIRNVHLASITNHWNAPGEGWHTYLTEFVEKMKVASPEMEPSFNGKVFSYKQHWITIHARKKR